MKNLALGAAALLCVSGAAAAQVTSQALDKVSTREFVRLCEAKENATACTAMLRRRSISLMAESAPKHCPAMNEFRDGQAVAQVTKWLGAQSSRLEQPASDTVDMALQAIYPAPCR